VSGTINISATASDNVGVAGVQFQLDGADLGAEDNSVPFAIVLDTTAVSLGGHTLTAVARDSSGNETTSAAVAITVTDQTAPQVSITAPGNGTSVTGTIAVSAQASDNVGVAGVQFWLDGANLGTEDTVAPYFIAWDTASAAAGSHTLTAVARDGAGNLTTSPAVTVTVSDTTAPVVSLTAPLNGAAVTGTIPVSATASDNAGVVGVQFRLDGVNMSAEDTSAPFSTAWDTATATAGNHTLDAVARDAAGNHTTSAAISVMVSDTTAPLVSITSPAAGATVSGTIAVSANASDNIGIVGIQFRLDGVNLGAEDTGAPYSTAWDTLTVPEGAHTLSAVARDAAGNETTSAGITVTVITPSPEVSITGPANGTAVSGTVTVTAVASDAVGVAGVQFKLDGTDLGAEDTSAPYSTTWETSGTTPGGHTLTAVARNIAGHQTVSAAVAVTVADTTAPAIAISSPSAGANISGMVTVSANASDNVGIAGVQFKLDGADLKAEDTSAPYSISWDAATATLGAHTLSALARDAAGNQTTSAAVTVTVADVIAPTVMLSAPASGATVTGVTTVSALANDNVGVVGVQFLLDGADLGLEDTTDPFTISWDTSEASIGAHMLTAVARDSAGNRTTSPGIAVTVPDTTAPQVSLGTPAVGASVSGTITVSAAASDNVGVREVQFQLDGVDLGAEDSSAPYSISWDTGTALLGAHTLTAIASDAAGNQTTSAAVAVTVVDTSSPTVALTLPANGATVTGLVSVEAAAADNVGVQGVQFQLDGAILATEDTSAPYSVLWDTAAVSAGGHTLRAVARDAAGNQTTSAEITITVPDTNAPAVSITSPAAGTMVTGLVAVSAAATDNVAVTVVQFMLDGSLLAEDTSPPYSVTWNATAATPGSHELTAIARDSSGMQTTSPVVAVTVGDITAPAITIVAPVNASTVTGSIAVSADASDNVGVVGVQFHVDGLPLGLEDTSAPYLITWDTSTVSVGSHIVSAMARDAAGNRTTSAAVTVTVLDSAGPSVSITAPENGSTVTGATVVTATATDNVAVVGVQFQLDGANLGIEATAPPYSVAWDTTIVSPGPHSLRAIARDAAGNQAASAVVLVTVIDSTAPGVSITEPVGGATVTGAVAISAAASDNVGVVAVQFQLDGVNLGTEDAAAPYSTSWNTASATAGPHILTAIARDAAGNQTTSTPLAVVVADTTAPTVSITAPANASTVSGTVAVSADAADNMGVVGVQFKLDGVNLGAEVTSNPFSISWDTTAASNGPHTLIAIGRDAAGNQTTSATVTLSANNTSPSDSTPPPPPSQGGGGGGGGGGGAPPPPRQEATAAYSIPENGGQSWMVNGTSGPLTIGYARLEPYPGSMSPSGVAIFGYHSGGVLVTEAGVPASPKIYSGRVFANVDGPVNTGIAIANTNSHDAVISYYFTNSAGTDFGHGVFALKANHQMAKFLNEAPFNGPAPMEGTFTFTSTIPVAVIALRGYTNERSEFLITTLPVASVGDNVNTAPVVLPHFASGGGWTTQVVLTNPSDTPQAGKVQFFAPGSTGGTASLLSGLVDGVKDSTFNYLIPPRGSVRMVTGNAGSQIQVGSVRVTPAVSSNSPSAVAIFSFKKDGITVTESSVLGAPAGLAFRVYVESSGVLEQIGSVQTGLAISNPSAVPAVVTLEIAKLEGSITVPPVSVTIPAGGQIARFLSELFPPGLPPGFQGILRVTATTPIHLIGLRGRYNERGDFLITTTSPRNDSISQPVDAVFPHVVSGGGYSTQFIILGESGAGALWVMSQDGQLQPAGNLVRGQ
jgi:hypothetical protein